MRKVPLPEFRGGGGTRGTFGATGYVCPVAEGRDVLNPLKLADTFRLRAVGLMGRRDIPPDYGSGLFFPCCAALHTCGMRFALDFLFLDHDLQPLAARRDVAPWRMVRGPKGSAHCLEVRAGTLPDPLPDRLEWR